MRNKFKKGDIVLVNGLGKSEEKVYRDKRGSIIERDAFFLDYNVEFNSSENDWFDEHQLKRIKKRERKIRV